MEMTTIITLGVHHDLFNVLFSEHAFGQSQYLSDNLGLRFLATHFEIIVFLILK